MQQEFEEIEKCILDNISRNPNLNESDKVKADLIRLPSGNRKARLVALIEETKGNFNHNLYPSFSKDLSSSLTDQGGKSVEQPSPELIKAKVMNLYGQSLIEDAILLLLDYLEFWMGDHEAWTQLSQFYIEMGMYKQAQFSLEEVLLLKPDHHLYLLAYADLLSAMSIEAQDEYQALSCDYYCASIEILETLHGWYGILATAPGDSALCNMSKKRIKSRYDTSYPDSSQVPESIEIVYKFLNKP
jgi:hypothetical protein